MKKTPKTRRKSQKSPHKKQHSSPRLQIYVAEKTSTAPEISVKTTAMFSAEQRKGRQTEKRPLGTRSRKNDMPAQTVRTKTEDLDRKVESYMGAQPPVTDTMKRLEPAEPSLSGGSVTGFESFSSGEIETNYGVSQSSKIASLSQKNAPSVVKNHQKNATVSQKRHWFLPKRASLALLIVLGLGFLVGGSALAKYSHETVLLEVVAKQAHDSPVVVRFSRPVKTQLQYAWTKPIEGSWRKTNATGGVSELIFQAKHGFRPGSRLELRLSNIAPSLDLASKTPSSQTVFIQVESAADISQHAPAAGEKDVSVEREITVTLANKNRQLRKLCLEGDVPVKNPCAPISLDDKTFRWPLETALQQTQSYTVRVIDQNQPEDKKRLKTFSFETVREPQVSSSFGGFIRPGNNVEIVFDQDMDKDAKLTFTLPGSGQWADARRYVYKTGAVSPGQTYSYTVAKGSKTVAGGFVSADKTFSVSTPGAVKVLSSRPTGSRVALDSSVQLTFDQPVDQASTQAAFSISPAVDGVFSWSGNTMTFKPSGLPFQTGYTVALAAGIKPVFGLPGLSYSSQFTTTYETKKLSVPYYAQVHSLSCEAASLRMALGYYGVGTSDDEILGRFGYAPEPRDTATNTWQDPYRMFVGSVDGKIGVDGWGVYSGPVAEAARSFGRGAEAISGVSAERVAAAIHAGQPVVLWGISGSGRVADSWNTATSGVVNVPRNAHVRTVYGVDGTADNPVGFYIHDPIGSVRSIYMSAGQLRANSAGNGGHAVVVY